MTGSTDRGAGPAPLPAALTRAFRRRRVAIVLIAGCLAGVLAYHKAVTDTHPRDFDQVWCASGVLLTGGDPYAAVGPGRRCPWVAPLYYPAPALVVAAPLAPLSRAVADAAFVAFGVALLALALTRERVGPALGLLSIAVPYAAVTVQWSPLLAAAYAFPVLGALGVAKPTIGAAIFLARPSWSALLGGLALTGIAFALAPSWVANWLATLDGTTTLRRDGTGYQYVAPVLQPGGVLALLAVLRWRRPEARLVALLACVPQTPLLYEAVPLLLVARSWRSAAVLAAGTWLAWGWMKWHAPYTSLAVWYHASGALIALCCYLPAVALVLRRPNEGRAPAWLERWLVRAPAWLAGRAPEAA